MNPIAGWLAVALLSATVWVPYVVRRPLSVSSGRPQPYRRRLRLHYYFGYAIVAIAVAHAVFSLLDGTFGASLAVGLWAAGIGLATLVVQLVLGLSLLDPGDFRNPLRRWHFATMWFVFGFVVLHVAVNSPMISGMLMSGTRGR